MMKNSNNKQTDKTPSPVDKKPKPEGRDQRESGGPSGLEPTRYGDWERKGRCVDF